jgi:hypothetical protein
MTTVYWNYYGMKGMKWFELTLLAPTFTLPEIVKSRDTTHMRHFVKCPAFQEYYKNTYTIKSPIDITIAYDKQTKTLSVTPQGQEFYDENMAHRGYVIGSNDDMLVSFGINYLFIADKDCELELITAGMHNSDFINKTRLIQAAFNINKWYRPIEIAFEIKDYAHPIKIKRGDPLAYVKFVPATGGKVSLEQKDFPKETIDVVDSCLYVKSSDNSLPLKTLYELSARIKNKLWFNKRKCPFNWSKK